MSEDLHKPQVQAGALGGGGDRPRVLVIDDSRSIRELLRLHLAAHGYDVLLAEDAIVGGRMLLDHAPHVLVVDVTMPFLSGIEFVAAIRSDPAFAELPVIFLTAQEDLGTAVAKLRPVAHLTKPVSIDRLLPVIELHSPWPREALKGPKQARVVVVEDNRDSAESLRRLLDLCGYQVRIVHTGREALATIRETTPHVVLCDIGLPDMDGYALAERIHREAAGGARLIAVTAFGSEEDRKRARQAGFHAHLVKPVDPGLLLRHIELA